MADIHILDGNRTGDGQIYSYRVVYHIPIAEPIAGVVFPDFESELPGIDPAELDAIKAGTLYELVKSELYNINVPIATQVQRLKDNWTAYEVKVNTEYPLRYKFFGTELNVD